MIAWIMKNPLLSAVSVALLAVCLYWQIVDSPRQYRLGEEASKAAIKAKADEKAKQQVEETLKKERKAAADLQAAQLELEKEKENAKATIGAMRSELGRLQQYAKNHGGRGKLPKTAQAACASDETAARGWKLFGESAARYAEMAEIADMQRDDLALCQAYIKTVE